MIKFFRKIFSRYESKGMLRNYLRSQYGPFLERVYLKSEPFYQEVLKEANKFIRKDAKVLDVGCATGRLVFEYEKLGALESVGIDTSESFTDFANLVQSGQSTTSYEVKGGSKARFISGDIFLTKDFSKEEFDMISCVNIVDRVPNPQILINKLYELLKKDGVLLLTDPYHWELSPAPKKLQVSDMKELFSDNLWEVEVDRRDIPYTIPLSETKEMDYSCHLLVVRKVA